MFTETRLTDDGLLRWAWRGYRRGQSAEALVRPWLADTLAVPEARVGLVRDHRGRPQLRVSGLPGLDANWSHSGDLLLVAVGRGAAVGVDIEWQRPRPQAMALARRFFTAREADTLATLPEPGAEAAFVRLWCAKEAVLKAHGHGLSFGLDRLEFQLRLL